jgi:polyhydroxyalkanoate synthesis regulator phasin
MEETASSSVTYCKNPGCRRLLAQSGGGHRRREYCGDACRQAARRHRLEQAHRDEVNRRWSLFTPETRNFLDWLMTRAGNGKELADAVEAAITRERDRAAEACTAQHEEQLATMRDKHLARVEKLKARIAELEQAAAQRVPRQVLSAEQARERARLHGGYLDSAYLPHTERLFVKVFQGGEVEPIELRTIINYERKAATEEYQQRITELERTVAELQAAHALLERNNENCQQKLAQAVERNHKLEKQVDIQRRQIGQYHQRFYPSSLAVARQRFMALGAALNYRMLLKYDEQAVGVRSGEQAWSEFATTATYKDLAQGMLQAQHLFDNLVALGMLSTRDAPGSHDSCDETNIQS